VLSGAVSVVFIDVSDHGGVYVLCIYILFIHIIVKYQLVTDSENTKLNFAVNFILFYYTIS